MVTCSDNFFQNNNIILARQFKVKWWSNYTDLAKLLTLEIKIGFSRIALRAKFKNFLVLRVSTSQSLLQLLPRKIKRDSLKNLYQSWDPIQKMMKNLSPVPKRMKMIVMVSFDIITIFFSFFQDKIFFNSRQDFSRPGSVDFIILSKSQDFGVYFQNFKFAFGSRYVFNINYVFCRLLYV